MQAAAAFGHVAFGGIDDIVDLLAREGFAQDVVDIGAARGLQRLVDAFVTAAGGHHGDGRIGHQVANALQVLEAVFAFQMDVDEDQLRALADQLGLGFLQRARDDIGPVAIGDHAPDDLRLCQTVLDDQRYAFSHFIRPVFPYVGYGYRRECLMRRCPLPERVTLA